MNNGSSQPAPRAPAAIAIHQHAGPEGAHPLRQRCPTARASHVRNTCCREPARTTRRDAPRRGTTKQVRESTGIREHGGRHDGGGETRRPRAPTARDMVERTPAQRLWRRFRQAATSTTRGDAPSRTQHRARLATNSQARTIATFQLSAQISLQTAITMVDFTIARPVGQPPDMAGLAQRHRTQSPRNSTDSSHQCVKTSTPPSSCHNATS